MERTLEEQVWERAGGQCEYCQMPQQYDDVPFEIDHIISNKHGGRTRLSNLALSCFYCNRFKGPCISGIDPRTKRRANLFNPRRHKWLEHFRWIGPFLMGRTPIGRATIEVLRLNLRDRVRHRRALFNEGLFPK